MIDNSLFFKVFSNDTDALLQLGYAYFTGEDGEKSKEQASVFFGKAVEFALKKGDAAEIGKIIRFLEDHTDGFSANDVSDTCSDPLNNAKKTQDKEVTEITVEDIVRQAKNLFWGRETEKDHMEAKRLFELAASEGNYEAKKYIAYMCMHGLGGHADYPKAEMLFKEIFYSNNKDFHDETGMCLAELYAKHLDNVSEAVKIWENLAFEGNADAQYNYGLALFRGIGVEPEPERGIFWWQNAADKGHKDAKHNLEILFKSKK